MWKEYPESEIYSEKKLPTLIVSLFKVSRTVHLLLPDRQAMQSFSLDLLFCKNRNPNLVLFEDLEHKSEPLLQKPKGNP
uniref:Uncharacterized protein n=1 Tax=Gossypium raimondii TaxID=29730 RepID=A0A0D2SGZ3_GOSRA|nr:hypothetical protein B456_007G202600 [Gossypium raimondii]